MSKEKIKELCEDLRKSAEEMKKDPDKARKFLIEAGIYTKSGKLSSNYKK